MALYSLGGRQDGARVGIQYNAVTLAVEAIHVQGGRLSLEALNRSKVRIAQARNFDGRQGGELADLRLLGLFMRKVVTEEGTFIAPPASFGRTVRHWTG